MELIPGPDVNSSRTNHKKRFRHDDLPAEEVGMRLQQPPGRLRKIGQGSFVWKELIKSARPAGSVSTRFEKQGGVSTMTDTRERVLLNVLLSSIISKFAPIFPPPEKKTVRTARLAISSYNNP